MARFPCSRCAQRYSGPQQTAYPAVVTPGVTYSERLRLCPECMQAVVMRPEWSIADPEDQGVITICGACGEASPTVALFCTYYEQHQERQDLYGRIHSGQCLTTFLEAVWGSVDAAQAAFR